MRHHRHSGHRETAVLRSGGHTSHHKKSARSQTCYTQSRHDKGGLAWQTPR
ncbi:hypothetical protein Acaty_c0987 [Acidithiobacillus caldus ATCC 51756]|uniref:Uncharacterized protein n=1 Tax=Acidithiobacillus caldus (strain ATCC 51756 / DSM 8584 / KU) TaxID=637389 RepID=A0A059ZTC6_ACICK|nr:hypothetical protein Acaty_c0987 [Acidithiobacillus caldus ATCC 51756]